MENCVSSAALDAARTRLDAAEAARETILLQHIANGVIIVTTKRGRNSMIA